MRGLSKRDIFLNFIFTLFCFVALTQKATEAANVNENQFTVFAAGPQTCRLHFLSKTSGVDSLCL